MFKLKNWIVLALIMVLVLVASVANVAATRHDIQGLVFIDDNLNGVWDVGDGCSCTSHNGWQIASPDRNGTDYECLAKARI